MKGRRKHGSHFSRVQLGNQRNFRISILPGDCIVRMEQRDAGTHHNLRFGKICRQLAEVLDGERARQWLIDLGQPDLFHRFATRGLERRLRQCICSSCFR